MVDKKDLDKLHMYFDSDLIHALFYCLLSIIIILYIIKLD